MCHSLSQVCNVFESDHSLYLKSCNINQQGLETEHILGNTCSRRTVDKLVTDLSNNLHSSFDSLIDEHIKNKWILV